MEVNAFANTVESEPGARQQLAAPGPGSSSAGQDSRPDKFNPVRKPRRVTSPN